MLVYRNYITAILPAEAKMEKNSKRTSFKTFPRRNGQPRKLYGREPPVPGDAWWKSPVFL